MFLLVEEYVSVNSMLVVLYPLYVVTKSVNMLYVVEYVPLNDQDRLILLVFNSLFHESI